MTEFADVVPVGSPPGGIGMAGGDVTFTYDTSNPYSNSGCMFISDAAPIVSGPSGDIPCNRQLTTVADIPGGHFAFDFNFTVSPGVDTQGNRVYDTLTVTEA